MKKLVMIITLFFIWNSFAVTLKDAGKNVNSSFRGEVAELYFNFSVTEPGVNNLVKLDIDKKTGDITITREFMATCYGYGLTKPDIVVNRNELNRYLQRAYDKMKELKTNIVCRFGYSDNASKWLTGDDAKFLINNGSRGGQESRKNDFILRYLHATCTKYSPRKYVISHNKVSKIISTDQNSLFECVND